MLIASKIGLTNKKYGSHLELEDIHYRNKNDIIEYVTCYTHNHTNFLLVPKGTGWKPGNGVCPWLTLQFNGWLDLRYPQKEQ